MAQETRQPTHVGSEWKALGVYVATAVTGIAGGWYLANTYGFLGMNKSLGDGLGMLVGGITSEVLAATGLVAYANLRNRRHSA